jgi:uncharacterized cupin superfamily protein
MPSPARLKRPGGEGYATTLIKVRGASKMAQSLSFVRIGAAPGKDAGLAPWPWNPADVLLAEGMKPAGAKSYEGRGLTLGTWACNEGAVEIQGHAVDEACFVVSGSVTLTDSEGRSETFSAGDAFLLPRGFRGTWAQSDNFKKLFVAISRD